MFNKIDKMLKDLQQIQLLKKKLEKEEKELKAKIFAEYYGQVEDNRVIGDKFSAKLSQYQQERPGSGALDYLRKNQPDLIKSYEVQRITINAA